VDNLVQNTTANYKLTANLNEANKQIDGLVEMTYINNSPDQLEFIWMMTKICLLKVWETQSCSC
jgi:hypothetical protein